MFFICLFLSLQVSSSSVCGINGGAVRGSLCVYIILIMLKLYSLLCRIIVTFSIVLGIFLSTIRVEL